MSKERHPSPVSLTHMQTISGAEDESGVAPPHPPRVSREHRDDKEKKRYPSPLKKTNHAKPPLKSLQRMLEELNDVSLDDNTTTAVDAAKNAADLIRARDASDNEAQKELEKLPIIFTDTEIDHNAVGMGFRVPDGCRVSRCINGDYSVSGGHKDSEIHHAILTQYPDGFSWMYWTKQKFGHKGNEYDLGECARHYGMATVATRRGIRKKIIFTDESRSEDHSFTIAAQTTEGAQVDILQMFPRNDEGNPPWISVRLPSPTQASPSTIERDDDSVYILFRSCMPPDVKNHILIRELLDMKQRDRPLRWWEMGA